MGLKLLFRTEIVTLVLRAVPDPAVHQPLVLEPLIQASVRATGLWALDIRAYKRLQVVQHMRLPGELFLLRRWDVQATVRTGEAVIARSFGWQRRKPKVVLRGGGSASKRVVA
jgi:hypothetical protein